MKNASPERKVHLAVLDYLRLALPGALIHHSPNGIGLTGPDAARQTAKVRHMGAVSGFPDLMVWWRGQFWCFEVKAEGNKASDLQAAVGQVIEENGGKWAVVRSVLDAEDCIREWRGEI